MQLDWDPAVLQWEECAPQSDASGQLLWRGLRVKVGMVFGTPTLRKPLNTGRADYFGAVPNLAARVCSLARPGQSLLDVDNAVVAALDSVMGVRDWVLVGFGVTQKPSCVKNVGVQCLSFCRVCVWFW